MLLLVPFLTLLSVRASTGAIVEDDRESKVSRTMPTLSDDIFNHIFAFTHAGEVRDSVIYYIIEKMFLIEISLTREDPCNSLISQLRDMLRIGSQTSRGLISKMMRIGEFDSLEDLVADFTHHDKPELRPVAELVASLISRHPYETRLISECRPLILRALADYSELLSSPFAHVKKGLPAVFRWDPNLTVEPPVKVFKWTPDSLFAIYNHERISHVQVLPFILDSADGNYFRLMCGVYSPFEAPVGRAIWFSRGTCFVHKENMNIHYLAEAEHIYDGFPSDWIPEKRIYIKKEPGIPFKIYFSDSIDPVNAREYKLCPDQSKLAVCDPVTTRWKVYATDYPHVCEDLRRPDFLQTYLPTHHPDRLLGNLRIRRVAESVLEISSDTESRFMAQLVKIAERDFIFENEELTARVSQLVKGAVFEGDVERQKLLREIIRVVRMSRLAGIWHRPRTGPFILNLVDSIVQSRAQAAWPLVKKFIHGQRISHSLVRLISATVALATD